MLACADSCETVIGDLIGRSAATVSGSTRLSSDRHADEDALGRRVCSRLVLWALLSAVLVLSAAAVLGPARAMAAESNGASYEPAASRDGRYVAFRSAASNLVSGDTNGAYDVFLRDRTAHSTSRVTVSSAGAQANGMTFDPSISADGRYVAYSSYASNLVSADTNGTYDVFVRDRVTGTTTRVSVGASGAQANSWSNQPSISGDGRYVAFVSYASNLVAGDTNGAADVFVYDRTAATTARVSMGAAGAQGNSASEAAAISGDGRYVAFASSASNLVAGDTNAAKDVFVYDRTAATTTRVSMRANGTQATAWSGNPSISWNGNRVAFESGDAIDPGDTNNSTDVYVRDYWGTTTWPARFNASSGWTTHGANWSPSISGDGRYVAFVLASDFVIEDLNHAPDIYEYDLATNTQAMVSKDDVRGAGNRGSYMPSLSSDSRYTAFESDATNFDVDANGVRDVYGHTWSGDPVTTRLVGTSSTSSDAALDQPVPRQCSLAAPALETPTQSGEASSTSLAATPDTSRQFCTVDRPSVPDRPGKGGSPGRCGDVKGELAVNRTKCRADPVNTATGAYSTQVEDLGLAGIGVPFSLVRSYDSGDDTVGPLGRGWTHSYAAWLSIYEGGAAVRARGGDGQQLTFTRLPDGSYLPGQGGRATLTATGGGYELVRRDQVRYRFDSSGNLTEVRDRNANKLSLSYTDGLLSKVTDTVGRDIAFAYSDGLLTQVTLPDGRKVSYGYTSDRLLSSVTDVRGGVVRYEYTDGRLSKVTDQDNHAQIQNSYDSSGRVYWQADARGKQTTLSWDPSTQTATVTDPRGKQWRDVYAGYALVREVDPLGAETSYSYDADLNVVAVRDPNGHASAMSYDKDANLLSHTDALGNSDAYAYNARNDATSHTDPRGQSTSYDYDGNGNLTRVTEPGGVVTSLGRDPAGTGLLRSVTDPRGKTTTYDHDGQGNVTAVTSPKAKQATFSYDASGRLTGVVDPRGNEPGKTPADYKTTLGYDAAGHQTGASTPLGHQTTLAYDPAGLLTSATDANNHATSYSYDAANRLTTVTAPGGAATTYGYDDTGKLTSATDANNHASTYGYDAARRLTSQTTPGGRQTTYGYDPAGNVTSRTDPVSQTTRYTHDPADRLIGVDYPDATADVTFGYDGNDNRVLMRDGEGTETAAYDELDRLTKLVRGQRTFAYAYDPASNLTRRGYPDGRVIDYAYDDDDQVSSVMSGGRTTAYSYDAAGQRTATSLPNGYQETRDYDRTGRLTQVQNARSGSVLSSFAYTLDPVGNPTQVQSPGSTTTYAYDVRDRLTEACYQATCPGTGDPFIRYGYDAVGNRTSETRPSGTTTYSHDTDDEITAKTAPSGTTTYSHDQNGNLTRAGSRTYGYDLAGQLTSTTSGSSTTGYRYDGDGVRTEQATGALKTPLVWDKNNDLPQLIGEENAAGQSQRSYTHGADEELISMTAGLQEHYYHRDALGSTTDITAPDGHAEWAYSYEPYGAARSTQHPDPQAPENPIGYAGQRLDDQSGLYHNRARDYDPDTGRFTATDPLPRDSTSAYAYANNNPTTLTDPSGLTPAQGGSARASLPSGGSVDGGLGDIASEKDVSNSLLGDLKDIFIGDPLHDPLDAAGLFPPLKALRLVKAIKAIKAAKNAKKARVVLRKNTAHIFRDAPGHLAKDTAENRALLQDAVHPDNLVGRRGPGGAIGVYRKSLPDGRQVWVEVRDGREITNGGVNARPR